MPYKVLITQSVLDLLAQLVLGVEGVGEPKVSDDDILVAVEQQVLELQISVNNASLVQVADTGDKLGEQLTRRAVLQIAVVEDVVEQLTARRILEDDADVALGLNHLMQANNVRVVEPAQDVDLAVDLGQTVRVAAQSLSPYELDGNLDAAVALPAHLDLAELALTKCLTQNVVTKLGPLGRALALRVVLSALASAAAAIVNALAAHRAEAGYRGQVGTGAHGRPLLLACLFAGNVVLGV